VATGVEAIEPPMFCSQSCGTAAVGGKKPRPVVMDASTTMAFSGIAIACAIDAGQGAGGLYQLDHFLRLHVLRFGAECACQRLGRQPNFRPGSCDTSQPSLQHARLVGIGEERNRMLASLHDILDLSGSAAPARSHRVRSITNRPLPRAIRGL
jgi:hypothetical protein